MRTVSLEPRSGGALGGMLLAMTVKENPCESVKSVASVCKEANDASTS
jgi:hypothetical protein